MKINFHLQFTTVVFCTLLLCACTTNKSPAFLEDSGPMPELTARTEAGSAAMQRIADYIAARERELNCLIGVSFTDPVNGLAVSHRGNELFHAASTMKVPVMIEVFRRAEAGEWAMSDRVVVDPNFKSFLDNTPYVVDARGHMETMIGKEETLLKITEQMIVVSDNLATNILITMCGAANITETMRKLGVEDGYVLRCVQDIPAFRNGFSNRMTPGGLTRMMEAIENGEVAGAASTGEMKRILLDQEYNDMIPRHLPDGIEVGHKTGSITGHRHDTAIVYSPDGTYFLTVMVAEYDGAGEDEPGDDGAKQAVADIALLVHETRAELLR